MLCRLRRPDHRGLIDPDTGENRQAQLFVAALGSSSYFHAEAQWSQELPHWIDGHVRAFAFFGGVTERWILARLREQKFVGLAALNEAIGGCCSTRSTSAPCATWARAVASCSKPSTAGAGFSAPLGSGGFERAGELAVGLPALFRDLPPVDQGAQRASRFAAVLAVAKPAERPRGCLETGKVSG